MRSGIVAGVFFSLLGGPLAAQTPDVDVTVVPRVGYTLFSAVYDGPAIFEGNAFELTLDLGNQLTYGAGLEVQLPNPRWSIFGDFGMGTGDVQVSFCAEGGGCDMGEGDVSARQFGVGVAREIRTGATGGPSVRLRLGGSLLRLTFEEGTSGGQTYSNPGVLAGIDVGFPLSPRLGLRLGLDDALVRSDTDGLEREFESGEGGNLELDSAWTNAARLSAALTFRF